MHSLPHIIIFVPESKRIEGAQALCNSTQLGISANNVGNINTANTYTRAESNLLGDEKGPLHFGQVVVWAKHLYL